jgi:2,5-diketo-D-gluconate reductase A
MTLSPTLTFNDGNTIPQLGYGVWQVEDGVAEKVVRQAFEAGFRHIDTARIYGNEAGVGRAIAGSGLTPEEIFITTKLWNADQGYEPTLAAFEESLDRLGLETLDLYLIHWMQPQQDKYVDTWKALIELQKRGRVKSIGVSNFTRAFSGSWMKPAWFRPSTRSNCTRTSASRNFGTSAGRRAS